MILDCVTFVLAWFVCFVPEKSAHPIIIAQLESVDRIIDRGIYATPILITIYTPIYDLV